MKNKNIEDIYGLSPMQEGILFEELFAPEESRFVTQCVTTLRGKLDRSALFHACQDVIACHTVLRTSFHWQNLDRPLQVVHRQVELSITEEDCQGLSDEEQEKRLRAFLEADRHRNFDISRAPLIRFNLIRCAEQSYQLISSHHHLLLDGWSLSLLLNEILTCYEARCCKREIQSLKPRPFRDYLKWLEQQDLKQSEAYWRATLKGFTSATPLAIDHQRRHLNRGPSLGHGSQEAQLSEATTYALHQLARRHQLTLHTIVQGAWALLLARYSRSQDVVFGVTVSVRPAELPTIEQMIGLFINTLPMLVQVSGETLVLEWLQDVQRQMSEMRQHEHTPLTRIQTWSEVERGQPLFKSLVVFENYPVKPSARRPSEFNSGLEIVRTQTFEQADYWLTLTVVPSRKLKLSLGYGLSLGFDDAAVKRMLAHLQTILKAILNNPHQTLHQIPLLTRAERRQLLAAGNNYVREPQQNVCLHQLFEERAKQTPDAPAISLEEQLTYEQLNQRADQLAIYLQKLGVRPEMKIGICIERSLEMVVALLGVLKAGAAYVPLDSMYPPERLSFIFKDADIEVLLTQSSLIKRLPSHAAHIVCLDSEWKEIAQQNLEKPQRLACPENLAYVIYTSGSTGKPKGVSHSHQSIVDYTSHIIKDFQLTSADRVLQFASLSFDVAVEEIFPTLTCGATLVLTPTILAAKDFLSFVAQEQLTVFELPTAFWHEWMREMSVAGTRLPECVRMVIVGGEEILPERFANWQQLAGHQANLVHVFGLTETAVTSTTYHVKPHKAVQGKKKDTEQEIGVVLPIGRPLPNTEIYVLDERFEPVPIGIVGELYVGGNGLAYGYLNQTELTADKFIPHAFSERKGARLYKTGDFVRYLADGNLEFVGRSDNQVKIRGFRIELGEIEAALREHPSVRDAVVVVKESATSDQQLVAYLISDRDELNADEIRLFLKEKLPSHMLPNAYVQLQKLPLTTNGKVDRHALPAPGTIRMDSRSHFIAPQSKLEQEIAALWQEVLQQERVGRHDNFFELGGHSLLMMRVYSKLRDKTAKEFSLIEMFNHPTIHALARFIARECDEEEDVLPDTARLAKLADGNDRLRQQFKRIRATVS